MHNATVLGVDIGGTHMTAAVVDLQTTTIQADTQVRLQVDSQGSASQILEAWAAGIQATGAWQPGAAMRIGISLPGPFDYEQGVSLIRHQNKFGALYGLNVKQLLARQLGLQPGDILMHNDAVCFMKGEVFGGAAKGAAKAMGLTLGTGLGAARFRQGIAEDTDLWCAPFKDSIAEEYLSTRALVRRYQQLSGQQVADVKELAAHAASEPLARQVFREMGKDLALFLFSFVQVEQPEVVVLGGNIAKAWDLFMPAAQKHLMRQASALTLKPAALGEEAAMMGAASYWQAPQPQLSAAGPVKGPAKTISPV